MACATEVMHVYASRFLSGVAGAGCFFVVPVYIAEISDKRIRGQLCASFSVICNIGIFVEFILAEYMNFQNAAILTAVVSVGFVVAFFFMPESPQFLISQQKIDEAEIAFKFFRGLQPNEALPNNYLADFTALKEIGKSDGTTEESQLRVLAKHISKPGILRGIFMAAVVSHFPLMSGCFVLITYNQMIFEAADVKLLSVFWSSLIFAFIQIIAALFTSSYVDKVGRKIILTGSSFASAACLAVFAAYMYLKSATNVDLSMLTLVPLISLFIEVFVSSVGIIPVPNFYGPEILDQKVSCDFPFISCN